MASLRCPAWPPDLFAVVASVLYQTGEYRRVVQPVVSHEDRVGGKEDWCHARQVGETWRAALDKHIAAQNELISLDAALSGLSIVDWWNVLTAHAHIAKGRLASYPAVTCALFKLFFASDEACAGFGMVGANENSPLGQSQPAQTAGVVKSFRKQAELFLNDLNGNRSLCFRVRPELVSVLPKLHTAQVGLTLRSLSHNLALCRASGIRPYWNGPFITQRKSKDSLSLLLLPWPDSFKPGYFRLTANHIEEAAQLANNSSYFEYVPERMPVPEFRARLEKAIDKAVELSGEIHAVVFPELSLSYEMYVVAEEIAWRHGLLLVAGVQVNTERRHLNLCMIQPLGLIEPGTPQHSDDGLTERLTAHRILQSKHHRWCLDRNQILQYRLGGHLSAAKRWWEYIEVPPRRVNFVAFGNWLTWCALICEDLARQDPAAQVIRAVGPNLVIALLMDGPQIQKRWPAKYASVLAEDPGCSVLTLSNLGMVRRCQPLDTLQPRDPVVDDSVVALWSDRVHGTREIALRQGEDACVLNLVCHSENEYTADGHADHGNGHFVVYAGHHTFQAA